MNSAYRIVLADGHVIFRSGMKRLIEEVRDLQVVGEAGDRRETLKCIEALSPDMAIVDISLPGFAATDLTDEICTRHPRTRVLILTMIKKTEYLYGALASGARGYLLKEDSDADLFKAIDAIRAGKTFISPSFAGDIAWDLSRLVKGKIRKPKERLSPREKQVLRLIVEGKPNRKIAAILKISIRTVENHRARVMKKLHLGNTADLVRYAIREELL
jgi:DNA-binding NarL/FixJ family response regulator